jgi:hypothetical protein
MSIGPSAKTGVSNRKSEPSRSNAAAPMKSFIVEAGMNRFLAFEENRISLVFSEMM